jgi:hypothetical protein
VTEDSVSKGRLSTLTRRGLLRAVSSSLGSLVVAGCDRKGSDAVSAGSRLGSTPSLELPPGPALPPVGPSGVHPLRRPRPGQRFVETNNGVSFFLQGDTAWSIAVSASQSDVVRYLDDRKDKGFNAITFETMEALFAGGNGNVAPSNWYGEAPFADLRDFTTPREPFWANIEYIVRQAAARDILCIVFPAYEGYGDGNQGWYRQMASQGPKKLQAYGAWLGRRYLAYDNIMWVVGGDNNASDKRLTRAIVDGIKSVSSKWLFGWHGARNTNALNFWANDLGWLDFNFIYDSADKATVNAEASYNSATVRPFARIEDTYENPVVGGVSSAFIRWLAWSSALQGGCGAIYGDVAIWRFNGPGIVADPTSWRAAMDRPAGTSLRYLKELYEMKSWTRLVPDFSTHGWMTSGWSARRLATLADDGSFGIVYAEDAGESMTFNMSKLRGPNVLVRWYDPTSGAFVADGTYVASGSRSFSRVEANHQRSLDWALLFESM